MSIATNTQAKAPTGFLPPHSIEAEEAVLGAILINSDIMQDVLEAKTLHEDDFYILRNSHVYHAMKTLYQNGTTIDNLTVASALRNTKQQGGGHTVLDDIGGAAYLTYLINNGPSSLNAVSYAEIVKSASLRRQALEKLGEAAGMIISDAMATEQALATVAGEIQELHHTANMVRNGSLVETAEEAYARMLSSIHQRINLRDQGEMLGLRSGVEWIDNKYWGLQRKKLWMYMAFSGTGKSALMTWLLIGIVTDFNNAMVYSTEMEMEGLLERMFAARNGLNLTQLGLGHIARNKLSDAVHREATEKGRGMLYWKDRLVVMPPQSTIYVEDVITAARQQYRERRIDILFVDYLQALYSREAKGQPRYLELAYIANKLKALAMELNINVFVLSQPNHDSKSNASDRRMQIEDIADAKAVRNALDIGIVGNVVYEGMRGITKLESKLIDTMPNGHILIQMVVGKARDWPTTTNYMYFHPSSMQFKSAVLPDDQHPF